MINLCCCFFSVCSTFFSFFFKLCFVSNKIWRHFPCFCVTTVMILSFRTDRSGQTVKTQIWLLEEQSDQGYTVCYSACIIWTNYSMVYTAKPVLVAASIKQATCLKRPVFQFPFMTNIKLPVLCKTCLKQTLLRYPLGACLILVGLYIELNCSNHKIL